MGTSRPEITRKQELEEKQLHWCFKRITSDILNEKTWMWLRKRNFKRKTESLLTAAQNNAIRTNHIKARIDKTQQNSKCRLCGDRDETINRMIHECNKLAQKEYMETRLGGQGNPSETVQEIEIWLYEQVVYAQPRICLGEWDAQIPRVFWDTKVSPNIG